jgi:hypothetical protein
MASTAANFERLYEAWGGNAELMASEIGQQGVTVRQWRNRGSIPAEYWPKIIERAAGRGVLLSIDDFGPSAEVLAVARAIEAEKKAAA